MKPDLPSRCTAGELPGLIAQLDAEFVTGRGRNLSLALRYPALFAMPENILVAREAGRIVAAIAVKPLRWLAGEKLFDGVMAGMVWTEPARRGQGLASALLARMGPLLQERADYAVLWTAQPGFYARCGWLAADGGSFGAIEGAAGAPVGAPVEFGRVRAIWRQQAHRADRDEAWQPPLPLPAAALEMFVEGNGYAIAGRLGDDLYCYEFVGGDDAAFGALFAQLRAGCRTLHFNEQTGSRAQVWLSQQGVKWENKPLAMWLPLRDAGARGWYVPWLDRI